MQWDKVKNILIAILLTINLFLLGNLAVRGWQSHRRTSELEANLRTLVSARGMQLDTAFSFPEDITLPELSLDRSRADEEKVAAAMLGEHAERTEQEDGTVRFTFPTVGELTFQKISDMVYVLNSPAVDATDPAAA